ncbi:MAG: hypothetical protein QOH57_1523 [Mycobacterium sp.]|jgi:hypothetical protein|nr:hypothetical protein [Mycobacterium sp.]
MERVERRLSMPLLEGWFAKESMTLLAPDGQANVIASSEPLDSGIDTQAYANVQGDLLRREFPGYVEHSFEPFPAFGRQGWLRVFQWAPPDGVRVTQMQMYFAENGRGYTATATTPSTQLARFEHIFGQILRDIGV